MAQQKFSVWQEINLTSFMNYNNHALCPTLSGTEVSPLNSPVRCRVSVLQIRKLSLEHIRYFQAFCFRAHNLTETEMLKGEKTPEML